MRLFPLILALLLAGCAPRLTPTERAALVEVRGTLAGVRQDYARGRVRFFAADEENARAVKVKLDELDQADDVLGELAADE